MGAVLMAPHSGRNALGQPSHSGVFPKQREEVIEAGCIDFGLPFAELLVTECKISNKSRCALLLRR